MSDQQPAKPLGPLGCLGAILLLPGLCALYFANESFTSSGGMGRDSGIYPIWAICFFISAWGVALITIAIRRRRRGHE
jgi:hypothetical protein